MSWDDIRLFLAIARTGSLSAAGRELGLHHATVLRHLDALEAQAGARLFHRGATGLSLAAAGEAALERAEEMEAQARAFERAVSGADRQAAGEVRLTAPEALLPLLVPTLARLRVQWPALSVCGLFTDRAVDLARREADVAVRPTALPPEDTIAHRVATVAWAVYGPVAVEVDLPWVAFGPELARLPAARWWAAHAAQEPVTMTVNSVPAAAALVRAGACQGVLPCFLGDADPALARRGPVLEGAGDPLWVLVHRDLRRAARVRVVVDALATDLGAQVGRIEGRA